ncbi:MFS monocarboxylate transporter [Metarhizium album ARSEF 1941]|uniref:MFS monocarboxylate transporter n=1 Tax=Metarhizium album (strain ARSEF 1941) TaxID=1081103 RepID=A0A0B2WFW3_METAS|nr:MFS monocarboxylate transporter [Metarhizium album ARSEF 1941]KHN94851.1 MFS monocarboxylate transporter [Metarhizium album ARSEF 1941]
MASKSDARVASTHSPALLEAHAKQEAGHPEDLVARISTLDRAYQASPPDGGVRAWCQVLAGHLIVFNTWGYMISFGIFQPYYAEVLAMDPSAIAWIGSVQIFLVFLVGTFAGRAFDAGYYRAALVIGNLLQLAGIAMTSVAHEYWQVFLAQGICQGLGCGVVFAPTVANVSTYFSKKKSIAISLGACGGAVGGIVFALMAQQLLPKLGFPWTVRTMGLVVLVSSVIVYLLVEPRLPPRKSGPIVEMAAFKDSTYLLFAVSMFFTLWAAYFAYYYARAYALNVLGGSQSTSFTMLLVINAVGIPGRLIPAFIADRYLGAVDTFIPSIFCAAICMFGWIGVRNVPADYAWLCIYGFFGAAIQGMFPSTLAGLTKDLSKAGTRIGMIFTIVSVAALTGPPLAGKLIEVNGGRYLAVQIWGVRLLKPVFVERQANVQNPSFSQPSMFMFSAPWICQSCTRVRQRSYWRQFTRLASNRTSSAVDARVTTTQLPTTTTPPTPSTLAPSLLQRAQSLFAEREALQKSLNARFDSQKARRAGELDRVAAALAAWRQSLSSIRDLQAMADDEQDPDLAAIARDELQTEQAKLESLGKKLSASLTPRHPFADLPCMIEFRPGPGGLEGRYFADSVFKMYKALCLRRGYRANVLKYEMADAAGDQSSSAGESPLQEAILEIQDAGAYDTFRSEAGMHRVQRIPSTESKGRVHTSAVAVWVLPSFPESSSSEADADGPDSDFYVNPQEVKVETTRARGAGGQHVNKTESAIRMTHLPTGTTVSMQDHRSQQRNREDAWKLLRSRIASQRAEQRAEAAARLRNSVLSQTQITRGDKIRTYNYNQDRCTDHRAGLDVHNLPDVLHGGETLDRVMDAAREWLVAREIDALVAEEEAKAAAAAVGAK